MTPDAILSRHGITREQVAAAAPQSGAMIAALADILAQSTPEHVPQLSTAERFARARDELHGLADWLGEHGHKLPASTVRYVAGTLEGIGAAVGGGA